MSLDDGKPFTWWQRILLFIAGILTVIIFGGILIGTIWLMGGNN